MSDRIDAIRARLGALATPTPWAIWHDLDHQGFTTVGDADSYAEIIANGECEESNPTAHVYVEEDADFIANAPADVAFLLAEVERLEGELAKTKRGAVTLGKIIDRQGRAVLDITGLHHMVDEDMDGDWGAIWDILAEQAAKGRRLQEEKADAWDEGRHFGQINDHAYPHDNPYKEAP